MNALTAIVAAADFCPEDPLALETSLHVGLVRLCGRDLAIPAECIREVVPLPDAVQSAFSAAEALAGSIVVRGQVIPFVNVAALLGFAPQDSVGGVVVVLRRDQDLIGLFVDAVSGLTSVPTDTIQTYRFSTQEAKPVVASSFALGERLYGMIDPAAILALPGIPRVREVTRSARDAMLLGQTRIMALRVAGAELALEATFVVATVPANQVRAAPGIGDQWAGVIDYLDLEVPVIDDIALLGLSGRACDATSALVIIVRLGDDQLLGIKADCVHRIHSVNAREICPLPLPIAEQLPLFSGSVDNGNGDRSLLLSAAAACDAPALRMIAALTMRKATSRTTGRSTSAHKDASGHSVAPQPYLVFRTGTQWRACALAGIAQIVRLPKMRSRLASSGSPMCGFISHAGAPVALVDLGSDDGDEHAAEDGPDGDRVILIAAANRCATGFIVDQLDTIAHAVAQTMPPRRRDSTAETASFIQARIGGREEAVRVCRLEDEVLRLTGGLEVLKDRSDAGF